MPDLPDYYTMTAMPEAEAYTFRGGADAAKPAAPLAKEIYLATDTKKLYICVVDGIWTGFDASILVQGVLTLYANMLGGGFKITNIADPAAAQDAATKAYVDAAAGTGILGITVGTGTRNVAGDQAIIGLGFKPKVVIFFAKAEGGANQIQSSGFDDGTNHRCVFLIGSSVDVNETDLFSIYGYKVVGDQLYGYISSLDADGFTITWALIGTLTVDFKYLALK